MLRVRHTVLILVIALMLVSVSFLPALAAPVAFVNIADTYTVRCSLPVRYMNGTYVGKVTSATLTISDNTTTSRGVISNASITVPNYGTVAVVGFVGAGVYSPKLSLIGSDGQVVVNLNGTVRIRDGAVHVISGRLEGWCWHSGGELGDDPVGSTAAWSTADSYNGSISALLTQGANAGSTYVQVSPPTGLQFHVHDLDSIVSGWGLWHRLQTDKVNGPQVELRFLAPTNVNPDGVGHVDVTLLPYAQSGTGAWVYSSLLSASTKAGYYGNDPWDGTAFDEFSGTLNLNQIEAAINEEAAMTANGSNASDWVLSRIRVEIWEAGARTCYIDDLSVNGTTYTFEPVQFGSNFTARP